MTVNEIFSAPIFLAPMAGVTDSAFRSIVRELIPTPLSLSPMPYALCPNLMFAEMVSCNGIHFRNDKTLAMLQTLEEERPIAIQIFGSNPVICAEAAKFVEDLGTAAVIDFNLGCPAPKIVKNGEGSALMKNPKLVGEIFSAIRKATTLPISAKIRLGFDEEHLNAVEIAKILEDSGVDFIAVHGRTRQQFYSGTANWEEIGKVKAAVKIPVIANGDVKDFDSLDKILDVTKADGVMVGRAAQGNPFIIGRLLEYLLTGKKNPPPTLAERVKVMRRHFDKLIALKGEGVAIREMRSHAAWYTKGLQGGAEFRNKFNRAVNVDDFKKIFSLIENST